MFGKLKEKLRSALSVFSKEVEEEAVITQEELPEAQEAVASEPSYEQERAADETETIGEPQREERVVSEEEPLCAAQRVLDEVVDSRKDAVEQQGSEQPPEDGADTAVVEKKKTGLFGFVRKEKAVVESPPVMERTDELVPQKSEGFFSRITKVKLSDEKFERLFWELEVVLLENNVAVEVIERIKRDLQVVLSGTEVKRKSVEELVSSSLKNTLKQILSVKPLDLLVEAHKKKEQGIPLIIAVIGVNGSGKTTTLAKLVRLFQRSGLSVVVAAADTFRAAAIQQLEEHTNKLGVKLIKHDYRADPSAVAFDAVKHAQAQHIDVVLIDTAGRLHSNDNLVAELKKLVRVNKPDINLFVGEAITGNDCVEQARQFDRAVGIDAIILAKADVDEKGGAAISASFVTGKPVIYLGVGQTYDDLVAFKPQEVISNLGL